MAPPPEHPRGLARPRPTAPGRAPAGAATHGPCGGPPRPRLRPNPTPSAAAIPTVPRAATPTATQRHAIVDALTCQWARSRRVDLWSLLAALERAGLPFTARPEGGRTFAAGDLVRPLRLDGESVVVHTTFLAPLGRGSPLPGFADEAVAGAPRLAALVNTLHGRLIDALYRAIRRCAYPASATQDRDDATSRRLVELAARDVAATELPPRAWLRLLPWAPLRLASARRLGPALGRLLADDLGRARITIEECVPRLAVLAPGSRSPLGTAATSLGERFVLGERAIDRAGSFRVRVDTLAAEHAPGFLRGGDALRRLFAAIRALVGPLLSFNVDVVLGPGAAPPMRLSFDRSTRFGVDAWLHHHSGPTVIRHEDPGPTPH